MQKMLDQFKFNYWDISFILLALIPGITFLSTTGDISVYFSSPVLDGQFLYIVSKLVGLYAMFLLWLQVMLGLLGKQVLSRLGLDFKPAFHASLGLTVVGLLLAHITLFVIAASIRNGNFAYQLLLPNLFGHYYPMIVSLGLIAAWLILVALLFVALRTRFQFLWKWGHRLTLPAFFLVFFHSYLIGSETRAGLLEYFYYLMFFLVALVLFFRIWNFIAHK